MIRPVILVAVLTLGAPAMVGPQTSLADNVDQAVTILSRFREMPEQSLPQAVGFISSGQGGLGPVVARTGPGWSGPSAVGTGGAGFGVQVGAQVIELVLVLNTDEAVRTFSRGGNVRLGAGVSGAAGPVGRTVGAAVTTRDDANADSYGRRVTADEILSGAVRPPASADRLRAELAKF